MKKLTNDTGNTINARIILDYIQTNGLKKREFCKECKIGIFTFYKIINNKNFKLSSLFRVAKKLQIQVHHLFK